MENKLPNRKYMRLKHFDYNTPGAYFITVCTENRKCILSNIVGTGVLDCPQIQLTEYGKVLDKYINEMSSYYESITVDRYVIMPNHFHMILIVNVDGQSGTPVPTKAGKSNSFVSSFVSTLKRFCNKEYGKNIWQSRFYDHIIRNREDYEGVVKYIYENPINWQLDELYALEQNL